MTTPATPMHTPTPWISVQHPDPTCKIVALVDATRDEDMRDFADGHATCWHGEADAAYILHCVNTHAQLVAALDEATRHLDIIIERENFAFAESSVADEVWNAAKAARAALSAAQEK